MDSDSGYWLRGDARFLLLNMLEYLGVQFGQE